MSHSPPEAAPPSKYEVIFDEALKTYENETGKDLKSDPLLRTLEACKSPDETLFELRQQIPGFDPSAGEAITGSQTGLIQWCMCCTFLRKQLAVVLAL